VIGLLVNPTNPILMKTEINGATSAAHSFEGVFVKLTELGAGGLVVGADPLFTSRSARPGELAAHYAMPAVFENRSFAAAGGLASYGSNALDSYRLTVFTYRARAHAFVLPDASTPAANRPVVAILAGKRTVSHSHSRIRSAIAHRLIACVSPTEVNRSRGAAPRAPVIVATEWPVV